MQSTRGPPSMTSVSHRSCKPLQQHNQSTLFDHQVQGLHTHLFARTLGPLLAATREACRTGSGCFTKTLRSCKPCQHHFTLRSTQQCSLAKPHQPLPDHDSRGLASGSSFHIHLHHCAKPVLYASLHGSPQEDADGRHPWYDRCSYLVSVFLVYNHACVAHVFVFLFTPSSLQTSHKKRQGKT